MISSLLHLVGLRPRVYYTLTNCRGGGGLAPPQYANGSGMKKTWQVIKETLSRNSKMIEMPSKFFHEGCELADPTEIANAFNSYFANIG